MSGGIPALEEPLPAAHWPWAHSGKTRARLCRMLIVRRGNCCQGGGLVGPQTHSDRVGGGGSSQSLLSTERAEWPLSLRLLICKMGTLLDSLMGGLRIKWDNCKC